MSNERGFSMIAVLIAIVLLSVGVLALARTGGEVIEAHTAAGSRSTALAIARGYLEVVRSSDPNALKSEDPVKVDESGQPASGGAYTRSVVVQDVERNVKQVKVIVEFPRSQKPVELVTLAFVGKS